MKSELVTETSHEFVVNADGSAVELWRYVESGIRVDAAGRKHRKGSTITSEKVATFTPDEYEQLLVDGIRTMRHVA